MISITFSPTGGGTPYVLADGTASGGYVRNLHVQRVRQVQVSPGLRWNTVKVLARYNLQVTMSFQVQRLHADEATALGYALTTTIGSNQIPASAGTLGVTGQGGSTFSGQLLDCVVQSDGSRQLGATTFNDYTVVGTSGVGS